VIMDAFLDKSLESSVIMDEITESISWSVDIYTANEYLFSKEYLLRLEILFKVMFFIRMFMGVNCNKYRLI
jgi:hypothetical protein